MSRSVRAAVALTAAVLLGGAAACSTSESKKVDGTTPATASSRFTAPPSAAGSGAADWPTYHRTSDRAGVAAAMPAVSGPLRVVARTKLDAPVYASPLVVGGLTIIATENDTVYAFDGSYRQVWKRHLGSPSPQRERECGNVDPLGVTGTPVYDPASKLLFVAAEYGGPPRHQLVAMTVTSGAVRSRRSLDLPGVQTKAMQERGALTVTGGRVWVPFGGQSGDCGGYKGRVVGVPTSGHGALVAYTVPTGREAGIWTPPGPAVDPAGNLYVAVGNGASGVGDPYDHSDSVLKIGPDGRLADSFSPTTWPSDNDQDLDLGSQGPALVGRWVFTAGKSGTAYVLRRDRLGGIGGQVSKAAVCRSFGGTAVSGDVVYVPCTDGVRAVRIDSAGGLHMLWHASSAVSGSPITGGGRVWSLDQTGGVLHALDPRTGRSTAQVRVGVTSRFATPAVSGRDVLIPTLAGFTAVRTS
jgi:outer membrane protein assembly factor BamB